MPVSPKSSTFAAQFCNIVYINNKEYTLDLKNNKIIPKEYNFYKYTGSLINDPDSTSYRWYCDIRCGFTFDPFMNPTGNASTSKSTS